MNDKQGKIRDALLEPITEAPRTAVTPETFAALGTSPSAGPALKIKPRKQRNPRGIFQRVRGKNSPWWVRHVDAQGRFRREKAGTKGAAIELYRKRKHEALEGKKLPEKLRRPVVPFSEICDDTEAYIKDRYAKPKHDLGRLEHIKKWFGSRSAESIDSAEIEDALNKAKGEGNWSASSFNHHRTLLSLTFRLAIRNKKAKENPVRGIPRVAENNSRVRFLTAEEEQKLRKVIQSNPAWREHEPELTLALNTGLRRSSMYIDLVWENIDLDARVASVPRTKNGEPVHVPLNADAMQAITIFRSRGDGRGRVVRNAAGEPLNYPTHWFVPAVRAAEIKNFRWHDARHCFASKLRQTGTPLGNIAELLGHKGLAMARRYAHLSISNLHDAVARIATQPGTEPTPLPTPEPETQESKSAYVQ
jgi:integrase